MSTRDPRMADVEGAGWDHHEDGYHGTACRCDHHCRECRYRLEGRQRRYCSAACGRANRAEEAFDQRMSG